MPVSFGQIYAQAIAPSLISSVVSAEACPASARIDHRLRQRRLGQSAENGQRIGLSDLAEVAKETG